jgi:hypothetical protein
VCVCVCVCVCFFFFRGAWKLLLRQWWGIWRVTRLEFDYQRNIEMELQTMTPFCQSTQQRKSWGHGDTRFVPCKKKFTRSCVAPCATNRGKKLSTIELIVWWVALFHAQLPSLCISGDPKCKFPHSFGRKGGGKNHKGKKLLWEKCKIVRVNFFRQFFFFFNFFSFWIKFWEIFGDFFIKLKIRLIFLNFNGKNHQIFDITKLNWFWPIHLLLLQVGENSTFQNRNFMERILPPPLPPNPPILVRPDDPCFPGPTVSWPLLLRS